MRILFIVKRNECYGFKTKTRRSAGLWNSTRFIVESLQERGITAKLVEVVDNNCIDREVTRFKPDMVIVEALWVVPEKFDVLKKLHPTVKWFVHLHSQLPFLSLEGIATEWLFGYVKRGLKIITNSPESFEALKVLFPSSVTYLPNVYLGCLRKPVRTERCGLHIGCFGAIRPLKNQLTQAIAAIKFARSVHKSLTFYVNSSRLETGGEQVLKNLVNLFANEPDSTLHLVDWLESEEFIHFLANHTDIGMQVSLSETFNVVSADYATAGIPMVVSKAVPWSFSDSRADEIDVNDIVKKLHLAWTKPKLIVKNQKLLKDYSENAQKTWFKFVKTGA